MLKLPSKNDPALLDRLAAAVEADKALSPLQRAIQHIEKRHSWVTGEMGIEHPDMPKERIEELFAAACPEWLIYQEYKRLLVASRD